MGEKTENINRYLLFQQLINDHTSLQVKKKQQHSHTPCLLVQIKTNPNALSVKVTLALSIPWVLNMKASTIRGLGGSVHGGTGGFAQHHAALLSEAGVLEVPT